MNLILRLNKANPYQRGQWYTYRDVRRMIRQAALMGGLVGAGLTWVVKSWVS